MVVTSVIITVGAATAAFGVVQAQSPGRAMTIDDLIGSVRIADPQLSPDGRTAAVACGTGLVSKEFVGKVARIVGAVLLSAFVASAAMPAGVAQTTLLDLTVANTFFDFDADDGGWTQELPTEVAPHEQSRRSREGRSGARGS